MTPLTDTDWLPASLHERGVAVPFTSPTLAGARLRRGERGCDLVVPHPGGGRGVYIFALSCLPEFCVPTLHDMRLAERLARLERLSPATMRRSARAVAAEGAAGRAAMAEAKAADAQDRKLRAQFETVLLGALLSASDPARAIDTQSRAARAVLKLGSLTGRDADAVRADIALLSDRLAGSGLDPRPSPAGSDRVGRFAVLLNRMAAMRSSLLGWSAPAGFEQVTGRIAEAAEAAESAGRMVLTAAQALLHDPAALLEDWASHPEAVSARLDRPDWILDGWEYPCLVWQLADTDEDRLDAVREIGALLPPVPADAEAWLDHAPALQARLRAGRSLQGGETGRTRAGRAGQPHRFPGRPQRADQGACRMSTRAAATGHTSGNPADAAGQAWRRIGRELAQGGDAQLLQVVRTVDALQDRGAADTILESVRPRLRAIQPARPLRFARLLFMPVDPVIVTPKRWRPGMPMLPRTALAVLARAMRRMMIDDEAHGAIESSLLARVDTLIEGGTTGGNAIVRQAGALLWPYASGALNRVASMEASAAPVAACRADWLAEGLAPSELQPTAGALAPILAAACALHDHDQARITLTEPLLLDMLTAAGRNGRLAYGMALTVLIIRVPEAAAGLLAAHLKLPDRRVLAETAAESALAWLETETAGPAACIADATCLEISRQAALLEALADQPDPARRRRVAEAKAHLLTGCLQRLATGLQAQVMAPLRALPVTDTAHDMRRDAALDAMEDAARTLRRFEIEARRLGGQGQFDALVRETSAAVSGNTALSSMDRARLMEILAGPEAAAALLL